MQGPPFATDYHSTFTSHPSRAQTSRSDPRRSELGRLRLPARAVDFRRERIRDCGRPVSFIRKSGSFFPIAQAPTLAFCLSSAAAEIAPWRSVCLFLPLFRLVQPRQSHRTRSDRMAFARTTRHVPRHAFRTGSAAATSRFSLRSPHRLARLSPSTASAVRTTAWLASTQLPRRRTSVAWQVPARKGARGRRQTGQGVRETRQRRTRLGPRRTRAGKVTIGRDCGERRGCEEEGDEEGAESAGTEGGGSAGQG